MHHRHERVDAFRLVEPTLDELTVEILPRSVVGRASALQLNRVLSVPGIRIAATRSIKKIVDHRVGTRIVDENVDQAERDAGLWIFVIDAGSGSPNDFGHNTVDEIVPAAESGQVVCAAKCVDRVKRRGIDFRANFDVRLGGAGEMNADHTPPTLKEQVVQAGTNSGMLGVHQHCLPQLARLVGHLGEWGRHRPAAFECHHRFETLAVVGLLASVESEGVGQAEAIGVVTPVAEDGVENLVFPLLFGRGGIGPLREFHYSLIASIGHQTMIPSRWTMRRAMSQASALHDDRCATLR